MKRRIENLIEGEKPSCEAKTANLANSLQSAPHLGGLWE
jgi:hypothetical protein